MTEKRRTGKRGRTKVPNTQVLKPSPSTKRSEFFSRTEKAVGSKINVLCARVRVEEKRLIEALAIGRRDGCRAPSVLIAPAAWSEPVAAVRR